MTYLAHSQDWSFNLINLRTAGVGSKKEVINDKAYQSLGWENKNILYLLALHRQKERWK